jgi:hypothetical protein
MAMRSVGLHVQPASEFVRFGGSRQLSRRAMKCPHIVPEPRADSRLMIFSISLITYVSEICQG